MRKNYFLIGVFALATITFAACSSEDKLGEERSDDNGHRGRASLGEVYI